MRSAMAGILAVAAMATASMQTPPASGSPRFEVASVKPNASIQPAGGGAPGGSIGRQGQRFVAVNTSLGDLVRYAFDLQPYQSIVGGPPWLADRYDITALMGDAREGHEVSRVMLRALLAERFKLDAGWQTREQPAYALVLARRDGRLGPGLKPSTEACDAEKAGRPPLDALREKALTAEEWTKLKRPVCDTVLQPFRARIQGGARTMGDLARVLSRLPALKAPVVDRTGLAGPFDFELSFNPDMSPAVGSPNVAANELPAPSLFVALQEQLGLKLESSRAPLEVLVIKHVERPSPD